MSNIMGQQSSFSIMIAVLISSALNNRKLGLESMRQEIGNNIITHSNVGDEVFAVSQSYSTMSLWLSMRDNVLRALLAIVEATGELCIMCSRTTDQLSCLTYYSQLLWEVSLFTIEGLPAVVGDMLTHSSATKNILAFLMSSSFKVSWKDTSSVSRSMEDFCMGNLHCVVEILSSYFRAEGKVPHAEGYDLCSVFFAVLQQSIFDSLSHEDISYLTFAAFESKPELFIPLRRPPLKGYLTSDSSRSAFHLLGIALDKRCSVDEEKISQLLDIRISLELYLHSVVLTLATARPRALESSGNTQCRSLEAVLNNAGMAYILINNVKFISSKLSKSRDDIIKADAERKLCDGIEIILNKLSSDSSTSKGSPFSLLTASKGYLNLISIIALNCRCQFQGAQPDVETEVRFLRNSLSSLLVSGLWESGIALAEHFSSRYSQDFANSPDQEFKTDSLNFDLSTVKKLSPFVGGSTPALNSSPMLNTSIRSFSSDDGLPSFTSPALSGTKKKQLAVTPGYLESSSQVEHELNFA